MREPLQNNPLPDNPAPSQGFVASPLRARNNWDVVSIVSFAAAGVLGIGTICNNIRDKFFHAFVDGYGESRTPFTDIIEKYNGRRGVRHSSYHADDGAFDALSRRHKANLVSDSEFVAERKKLTHEFRREINERLLEKFNVPSEGFRGWTEGNLKRWQMLGNGARRDASLGFAALSAISIGAISIMRNSKNTLDRVEDKLDEKRSAGRQ
jgi:hypothetical protein